MVIETWYEKLRLADLNLYYNNNMVIDWISVNSRCLQGRIKAMGGLGHSELGGPITANFIVIESLFKNRHIFIDIWRFK